MDKLNMRKPDFKKPEMKETLKAKSDDHACCMLCASYK